MNSHFRNWLSYGFRVYQYNEILQFNPPSIAEMTFISAISWGACPIRMRASNE
jgi:hypothetical protein